MANGLAELGLITIEQGTAMGRTSLIQVEVLTDSVRLVGRGVKGSVAIAFGASLRQSDDIRQCALGHSEVSDRHE